MYMKSLMDFQEDTEDKSTALKVSESKVTEVTQ